MNQVAYISAVAIVSLAAFAVLIGFAYRIWVRPGVCAHFGEEFPSRHDREAIKRRRSFEWRCGCVLSWFYVSIVVGTIRVILAEIMPELMKPFLVAQIAALAVAAFFIFAARSSWLKPFED